MKKVISILLILAMLILQIPAAAFAESANPFTDVKEGAWYYNSVQFVYENDLMSGTSGTTFGPDGTLTREMFVTILGRYAGIDQDDYTDVNFTDVKSGQWYSSYVDWAQKTNVTSGMGDGSFGVGKPVTREQMAVFIANYVNANGLELAKAENPVTGFQDIDSVSSWAKEGLELMRTTGIIAGDTAGNFNPKDKATRSQAAAIFERQVKAVQDDGVDKGIDVGAIGSIFTFGSYEQDNNLNNGKEPIKWIVLDKQDGKALLISKYALDTQQFSEEEKDAWETSTLREWLNDTFISSAFSIKEQSIILNSTVTADAQEYSDYTGNNTKDQVFLLSVREHDKYFTTRESQRCVPTKYAVAQGGYQYTGTDSESMKDGKGCCNYWLRTSCTYRASVITETGFTYENGLGVTSCKICVRPAIWINLKNDTEEITVGNIGSTLTFGSYEQDNDSDNGTEAIEWIVLDKQDDKALIISKYALDCKPYNDDDNEYYTCKYWKTSTLRTWLNFTFLDSAFSVSEQSLILNSTVTADMSPEVDTDPGSNTKDKIFLLSIPEANQYFSTDESRKCLPTAYAVAQGAYQHAETDSDCLIDGKGCCWYWLRTPSQSPLKTNVRGDGSIDYWGNDGGPDCYVEYLQSICGFSVRPALWINLKS